LLGDHCVGTRRVHAVVPVHGDRAVYGTRRATPNPSHTVIKVGAGRSRAARRPASPCAGRRRDR
jgi:hypothetical protein